MRVWYMWGMPNIVVVPPKYSGKASVIILRNPSTRRRIFYILLGLTLGVFGAHNFYAGYRSTAITQLLISLLSLGSLAPFVSLWAVREVLFIDKDAEGCVMELV